MTRTRIALTAIAVSTTILTAAACGGGNDDYMVHGVDTRDPVATFEAWHEARVITCDAELERSLRSTLMDPTTVEQYDNEARDCTPAPEDRDSRRYELVREDDARAIVRSDDAQGWVSVHEGACGGGYSELENTDAGWRVIGGSDWRPC